MSTLTDGEVRDIVESLVNEQHFRDRNLEWSENRRLVYQQRPVVIPGIEMETEHRTPELLEAADKYTARFLGASFTVNVSAQGPGPKAEQKAQAMENYDYRFLKRTWDNGCFTGAIHDMVGVTGEGWTHLTLNRAILPVIPQKDNYDNEDAYLEAAADVLKEFSSGEKPDLFVVEPVREPECIYYTPDRSLVMARMLVPLGPLQKQYGRENAGGLYGEKGKSKRIGKDSQGRWEIATIDGAVEPDGANVSLYQETVTLYIVETADCIYHLVEDGTDSRHTAELGKYKNVFGAPGFVSVRARETNHPSSQYQAHPLTHAAIAIAPQVNILRTIVYSGGILGEMQRITLEPLPGAEASAERANNKNLDIELIGNRVVKFPDGYKAVQPNIGVNADTLNALSQLEQKMLQYGYPPELGQPSDVDASSGYQQAVMRDTVANVIDPPLANIASMLNRCLQLKDTGIQTVGIDVTFRNFAPTDEMGKVARSVQDEITISPDDIVEVDRVVKFDSLTQYARQSLIELGRGLLSEERITEDMFMRDYMGVDDPQRLKRQRLMEKAMRIAEDYALKTSEALFGRVVGDVGDEAVVDAGLAGLTPQPSSIVSNMNGANISNGAGGNVPLNPAPNPMAELGAVGAMG